MASLTVRRLDDKLKKQLRLRAARNGRSVEDEVRTILRSAAADADAFAPRRPAAAAERSAESMNRGARASCSIIGGGIAAYKSLDLIRRLRERGVGGARDHDRRRRSSSSRRCRPARSPASSRFTDLFDAKSEFDVGHIRLAREAT